VAVTWPSTTAAVPANTPARHSTSVGATRCRWLIPAPTGFPDELMPVKLHGGPGPVRLTVTCDTGPYLDPGTSTVIRRRGPHRRSRADRGDAGRRRTTRCARSLLSTGATDVTGTRRVYRQDPARGASLAAASRRGHRGGADRGRLVRAGRRHRTRAAGIGVQLGRVTHNPGSRAGEVRSETRSVSVSWALWDSARGPRVRGGPGHARSRLAGWTPSKLEAWAGTDSSWKRARKGRATGGNGPGPMDCGLLSCVSERVAGRRTGQPAPTRRSSRPSPQRPRRRPRAAGDAAGV